MSPYEVPLQVGKFSRAHHVFIHDTLSTYKAIVGPRQSGRTYSCLFAILRAALTAEGAFAAVVVTPTSMMGVSVRTEFISLANSFCVGVFDYTSFDSCRSVCHLGRESGTKRIHFFSAEVLMSKPELFRGFNFDMVCFDNADLYGPRAYELLAPCLRANGVPGRALFNYLADKKREHWAEKIFSANHPDTQVHEVEQWNWS